MSNFKVDFMIIGAGKSGTTSLFSWLDEHPNLVGASNKEPHFFSTHPDWRSGIEEYEKLFIKQREVLYFEASTSYTYYPHRNLFIWEDLFEFNPKMKFIYLVRNPLERFISHYMHSYERGYTNLSLSDSILNDHKTLDVSRYSTQILPFIERFGRENVLILDFDDLKENPKNILKTVCVFLSIDAAPIDSMNTIAENKSLSKQRRHHKYDSPPFYMKVLYRLARPVWNKIVDNSKRSFTKRPQLGEEDKKLLLSLLRTDIMVLEKLMSKDLSHWK